MQRPLAAKKLHLCSEHCPRPFLDHLCLQRLPYALNIESKITASRGKHVLISMPQLVEKGIGMLQDRDFAKAIMRAKLAHSKLFLHHARLNHAYLTRSPTTFDHLAWPTVHELHSTNTLHSSILQPSHLACDTPTSYLASRSPKSCLRSHAIP